MRTDDERERRRIAVAMDRRREQPSSIASTSTAART
jgi:hypothetical protein